MNNGVAKLTEIEQLKMENFALKHNMLQSQMQMIVAERALFIDQINTNHPGFIWDDAKGLVAAVPQEVIREG